MLVLDADEAVAHDRRSRDHRVPDRVPSAFRVDLKADAFAERVILELDRVVAAQAARGRLVARFVYA